MSRQLYLAVLGLNSDYRKTFLFTLKISRCSSISSLDIELLIYLRVN